MTPVRPRRVLLVDNDLSLAGAEVQLMHLAKHLRRRGDDVMLMTILPIFQFEDDPEVATLPLVHVGTARFLRTPMAFARAWRTMRRFDPDIAVSFVYHANVMTRIVGLLARVPVIVSSIRNERFGPPRRDRIIRLTDRLATLTTTNSARAAARLVRDDVVPAERLRVIPNGIDVETFAADPDDRRRLRAELSLGEGDFAWLAAGRLTEQKDLPTLLRAFVPHHRRFVRSRLLIAGKGELRAELEALARDLQVDEAVTFLGERSDVPRLMAAADAFVLSSAWEGLPNVVMEAMAAGRPVVATDVGGVSELLEDGETGAIVPPGRAQELARAMDALVEMPEERRVGMGRAGRRVLQERFALDRVMQQWSDLLDELTSRRGMAPVGVQRAPDAVGQRR